MSYKTLDLFAGAGGLSLGFKMSGNFDIVAAAEINKNAQTTYLNNIPDKESSFEMIDNVRGYDFAKLNERIGGIDIVIGGPPCQGFSNANRQKNHLINMNNALVKEYFRAIQEIKPKAFIMENVKMLSSEKHRFFESEFDNDQIIALRNAGAKIPLQTEKLFISPPEIIEITSNGCLTEHWEEYVLPEKLRDIIRILNKNILNSKKLPNYLKKHEKEIIKQITIYLEEPQNSEIAERLNNILDGLTAKKYESIAEETNYLATMQKALIEIKELFVNRIIGSYLIDDRGNLVFETNSYSVIDYINAILGDTYIQIGEVLNAKWFGVPQDRKRHIVFGLRKDIVAGKEINLPKEPKGYQEITVGDAIGDLIDYPVGFTSTYKPIPYHSGDKLTMYEAKMRRESSSVKNHIATSTRATAQERFAAIKQGENFHSLDESLKTTYSNPERTQNTIYLRLAPNAPSGTVVNVRKSMWIHPELNRAVSVREAARLQSFPDSFAFFGTKDSQYQQVGNAVPPLLAKAIANNVKEYL